jgi:hypothetical protein
MAWHFDFVSDKPLTKEREIQLRQLDALSKAGLLDKFNTVANIADETKKVIRYRLSWKGWAASRYKKNDPACFVYGTPRYLGSTGIPTMAGKHAGFEIYMVKGKVGLGSEAELAPWAKNQEFRSVFPEIDKMVDGKEYSLGLIRDGDEWFNADDILNGKSRKSLRSISEELKQDKSNVPKIVAEGDELPDPTVDELRKLLQTLYGNYGDNNCLYLPSDGGKLPVDKELYRSNSNTNQDYAVAIFTNKDRTSYDRVFKKTIPYLNMLEQLGIVTKHAERNIPGEGREEKKLFDAQIFELTSQYKNRNRPGRPYCFPLGKPTVEIVDIQLGKRRRFGGNIMPESHFRYKLRVMYKNLPVWMNDSLLMDSWPELKGIVERGWACDGALSFDRKTRKTGAGGGSCWWAFDSYYENY